MDQHTRERAELPRKVRMTWPQQRRPGGAVTRSTFDPGTGWTLQQARELLAQGYSQAQASRISGYPVSMLRVEPAGAAPPSSV